MARFCFKFVTYHYGATRAYFLPYDDPSAKHKDRMSDPDTTYCMHEEVQHMCLMQDLIRGLQHYIEEEWGVASDMELKASSNCFPEAVSSGPMYHIPSCDSRN